VATRTHCALRYYAPLAKHFTVCITYQSTLLSKQGKIKTHFAFAFSTWMCNLVSHIKGGMYTEDVSEQGAERDIRLTTGREGAREGDE